LRTTNGTCSKALETNPQKAQGSEDTGRQPRIGSLGGVSGKKKKQKGLLPSPPHPWGKKGAKKKGDSTFIQKLEKYEDKRKEITPRATVAPGPSKQGIKGWHREERICRRGAGVNNKKKKIKESPPSAGEEEDKAKAGQATRGKATEKIPRSNIKSVENEKGSRGKSKRNRKKKGASKKFAVSPHSGKNRDLPTATSTPRGKKKKRRPRQRKTQKE